MKFKHIELVKNTLTNRNNYLETKEAIAIPFNEDYKFNEYWRGMYCFESKTPKKEDAMFGNFYFECDSLDFNLNKETILSACNYLRDRYDIPYYYLDFFSTNRSIWVSVPTKVFGCFGRKDLYKIHKLMATEINDYLSSLNKKMKLDLSIYKWNGLIHSLGSYLPKTKSWVSKFTYMDLLNSTTIEDLQKAKYDNFFSFEDVEIIEVAKNWFNNCSNNLKEKINFTCLDCSSCRKCMQNLNETRNFELNRNIHVFTYSLYLKEQGLSLGESIDYIQGQFVNDYVLTEEAKRSIKSAYKKKYKISCSFIKENLDEHIFDCKNCDYINEKRKSKDTFVIPRLFISQLNEAKAHYDIYKLLIQIMYDHQVENKNHNICLNNIKYKQRLLDKLDILKSLKIISYKVYKKEIVVNLEKKDKKIYKSHIVLPNNFLNSYLFKNTKFEFKVLLELLRMSIKSNDVFYFNTKFKTLLANLNTTKRTLTIALSFLKKQRVIIGNYLTIKSTKKERRLFCTKVLSKYRKNKSMVYLNNKFKKKKYKDNFKLTTNVCNKLVMDNNCSSFNQDDFIIEKIN